MTDETTQGQGEPGDGIAGDDPSIAHGELPEPEGVGANAEPGPDGTVSTTEPAAPGTTAEPGQPGSPGAEAPDPAGIEPGETQSVPTLRGPGPGDDGADAQA